MRIVMDEAGDVPAELIKKLNIVTVPVNIHFGTEEFLSNVTMTHPQFYEKTKSVTNQNFPKTSQPNPFQFVEKYRQILDEGEKEILAITVSEKLSKTYDSALSAAKELEGQGTFHTFDSMGGSSAQGWLTIEAARMAKEGASYEAIKSKLEKIRAEQSVVFTIDSLEYAVKGGRVSSVKSVVASLLSIKPILRLENGRIEEAGRVRTRKKALDHIVEMVKNDVGNKQVNVAVMHANANADAELLRQKAVAVLKTKDVIVVDMAIAVAINLGPGALGLAAVPV